MNFIQWLKKCDAELTRERNIGRFLRALNKGDDGKIAKLLEKGALDVNCIVNRHVIGPSFPEKSANRTNSSPGASLREEPILIVAIRNKNAMIAELLLNLGADPNQPTSYGLTPLQAAINDLNDVIVEILLYHKADMTLSAWDDCRCPSSGSRSALNSAMRVYVDACEKSYISIEFEKLLVPFLEYGSRESPDHESQFGPVYRDYCAMCKAIIENDLGTIRAMLGTIEDLNFASIGELPPAVFAAWINRFHDRREIVEIFLQTEKGSGAGVIDVAEILFPMIAFGDLELVRLCLEKGTIGEDTRRHGMNALHFACREGSNFKIIQMLVEEYGFDVETKDDEGRTALCYAINQGYEHLKFMLGRKIAELVNRTGMSLLYDCRYDCRIYELLLRHGSDPSVPCDLKSPNQSTNKLNPPFHICSNIGHCKVVKYFRKVHHLDPDYVRENIRRVFKSFDLQVQWDRVVNCRAKKFRRELEKLKRVKISEKSLSCRSMTLFDFMFFDPCTSVRYSRNENLNRLYEVFGKDFENPFKEYGFILNYQFRKSKRRRSLVESARELLHFAIGMELPDYIGEEMFGYFSDKRLLKLCDSIENCT